MSDEVARRIVDPELVAARDRVRAVMAPNGKDLERVLVALHLESAKEQRRARKSRAKLRAELLRRLQDGETLVIHGNEVVVEKVSNSDLIRQQEADANSVKVEAMAQRSYDVHHISRGVVNPTAGSIEDFIERLEQEEQTEGADADVVVPDW